MSDNQPAKFLPVMHNGVAYLRGSAASLILSCPNCGRDRFREAVHYFGHDPAWEKCFECTTVLEPVRVDEIETKWRPLWQAKDGALPCTP